MIKKLRVKYLEMKPRGRHYLAKIGLTKRQVDLYFSRSPLRNFQWWKERRKYGFDERDLYDLDHTLAMIIYERLKMFNDRVSNAIYFESKLDGVEWRGQVLTLQEAINLTLGKLEKYLTVSWLTWKDEKIKEQFLADALELLSKYSHVLWW